MDQKDEFDKVLEAAGDKGRYQSFLVWLFYAPLGFLLTWIFLFGLFNTSVPDHWCRVPGRPENVSLELWKNLTIPWIQEEGLEKLDKCHQYATSPPKSLSEVPASENTTACTHGWQFDDKWYDETLATRNEWVCENRKSVANYLAVGSPAGLIGIFILNPLSDIVGRKWVVLSLCQLVCITSLLKLVFPDGWGCFVVEFISSFFPGSLFYVSYIWVSEQVGNSWRHLIVCVFFVVWIAAMSLLPLIAWLTRSWVWLTVIASAPFFFFVFGYRIHESPRWLASVNKRDLALEVLTKISKTNGRNCEELQKAFGSYLHAPTKEESLFVKWKSFCKSPKMMFWLLGLTISTVTIRMTYSALNYNFHNLAGNEFVNFFLLALVELPSIALGWAACETVGRRLAQCIILLTVSLIVSYPILIARTDGIDTTVCAILGKIFINGSFYILYLQKMEIFPTSHRAFGTGVTMVASGLFGIATPYIAHSSAVWSKLPYVFMAGLSLLGCAAATLVPETLGHNLPQTIADCEAQYGQQPFWSYRGRNPKEWRQVLVGQISVKSKWCL